MFDKKVSIIIPCYNYARFLKTSVQCALNQTYKNIEVIVVNDGSTDNTDEVAKNIKNIIYIEQENKGISGARNTGIEHASGDWIYTLDADDTISENLILDSVELIDDNYTIVGPIAFDCDIDFNLIGTYWPTEYTIKTNTNTFFDLLTGNRTCGNSLFSKEMWEKVGGYDVSFDKGCEDWAFWIEMVKNGCIIKYVRKNEPYFKYRKHGNSILNQHNLNNNYIKLLSKYNLNSESRLEVIKNLYRLILNREYDEQGLNNYFHSNLNIIELRDTFFHSNEYANLKLNRNIT